MNFINSFLVIAIAIIPLASASCNIDSASLKTYSTSDGLVVTKVGITASFRLGCSAGTTVPLLHGESDDGRYLAVSTSNENKELRQVSFIEDLNKSKSRWVEIKIYDDDTYKQLVKARESGYSVSSYKPLKTILHSHYGVVGGPVVKIETIFALSLVAAFFFANSCRSKIVH